MCRFFAVLWLALLGSASLAGNSPAWWIDQKVPRQVVRCTGGGLGMDALVQSLSGLAARAVNEGRSDEMVWMETASPVYAEWLRATLRRTKARDLGLDGAWDVAVRYRKKGLVKGFVLWSMKDGSLNAATVRAGLEEAILVEESLARAAQDKGFSMVYDARGESPAQCFEAVCESLSRDIVFALNPLAANNRDLAIARRAMVCYGVDSLYTEILRWLEPLSAVVGWNEGAEGEHIEPPSRMGHFNTVSDWCVNLPLLSAGSREAEPAKLPAFDPAKVDYNAKGSFHALVMSDGDNLQWAMGSFFGDDFLRSHAVKKYVLNWTGCPANVMQASPATWTAVAAGVDHRASMAEFSGGYIYPDVFGADRPRRWELLAEYARRTGERMAAAGVTVLHLMMRGTTVSEDAQRAYGIYAREIPGLTGILAIGYNPYHGGGGRVFWVRNADGIEIPVVTARYSMWGKLPDAGFGRPDQIARWLDADAADPAKRFGWSIVHAWSRYTRAADGTVTDADNNDGTAARGAWAALWCAETIKSGTRLVSVQEMLWRLRMEHDPVETQKIITGPR